MTYGSRGIGGLALALVLAAGCGGEEAEPQQRSMVQERPAARGTEDGGGRPPSIQRVTLDPRVPSVDDAITAVVEASDPDGDEITLSYEWTVNGRPAGSGESLRAGSAKRGDRIAVSVVASDGSSASAPRNASAQISTGTLQVTRIDFEPKTPVAGDVLTVIPDAVSPGDDPVEFEYHWLVNDQFVAERSSRFATADYGVKRGDRIAVDVVASDGDTSSDTLRSNVLVLANAAPKIKGIPTPEIDAGAYRYQFEAEDADGDRSLRFSLGKAPAGMTIDPMSGVMTWKPGSEQAGDQLIEVNVRDGEGAESGIRFTVAVSFPDAPAKQDGSAGKAKPAPAPAKAAPSFSDDEDGTAAEADEAAAPAKDLTFSDELDEDEKAEAEDTAPDRP
jgi:hypothetical protein